MSEALLGRVASTSTAAASTSSSRTTRTRSPSRRCAHPEGEFARYWLHNGFLNVEGEKMSKSLGNFFTVRDLLDRGISGEVMRFVLLSTHYRQPMDWTEAKVHEATVLLTLWEKLLRDVRRVGLDRPGRAGPATEVRGGARR